MTRTSLFTFILLLGSGPALAETFVPTPILPQAGVQIVTRAVAQELVGRRLFGDPYRTVVIGNVDVYDRFPYLEARYFQVVSDPSWGRLLYGEVGKDLQGFDGKGSAFGELRAPHGMAVDADGRLFVADSGNDRVLVFTTAGEYDQLTLSPRFAIAGLSSPFDVAVSDNGTPLDPGDDRLYVADSGRNRVLGYRLADDRAELVSQIGDLGSGTGFFAGPMAITVGRQDGRCTSDVYVADAHNGRIVHLRDTGSALEWVGSLPHDIGIVTSLESDHYGNLYAAAPNAGVVQKLTPQLYPVAELGAGIMRPRSFHIPFVNIHDHRDGSVVRAGQGYGVLVEEWSDQSGLRLMDLGVALQDLHVVYDDGVTVRFTLTDHADVTIEAIDPASGRTLGRQDVPALASGPQAVRLDLARALGGARGGEVTLRVAATSHYSGALRDQSEVRFTLAGGGDALPTRLALLGNHPNPFNPSTTIAFVVPAGPARSFSLRIYDNRGRLVTTLAAGDAAPGPHDVVWDGRDSGGRSVSSGVYHYRLSVGNEELTDKMVLVK
jgi:hypothetical protein